MKPQPECQRPGEAPAVGVDGEIAAALHRSGPQRDADAGGQLGGERHVQRTEVAAAGREREPGEQPEPFDGDGERAEQRRQVGGQLDREAAGAGARGQPEHHRDQLGRTEGRPHRERGQQSRAAAQVHPSAGDPDRQVQVGAQHVGRQQRGQQPAGPAEGEHEPGAAQDQLDGRFGAAAPGRRGQPGRGVRGDRGDLQPGAAALAEDDQRSVRAGRGPVELGAQCAGDPGAGDRQRAGRGQPRDQAGRQRRFGGEGEPPARLRQREGDRATGRQAEAQLGAQPAGLRGEGADQQVQLRRPGVGGEQGRQPDVPGDVGEPGEQGLPGEAGRAPAVHRAQVIGQRAEQIGQPVQAQPAGGERRPGRVAAGAGLIVPVDQPGDDQAADETGRGGLHPADHQQLQQPGRQRVGERRQLAGRHRGDARPGCAAPGRGCPAGSAAGPARPAAPPWRRRCRRRRRR